MSEQSLSVRYWWPSYAQQLLTELQRQQNSSQFCDTLLQTEGISVPAHGCVLAALSPQLSERLSGSPSSPLGQRRKVRLDAVAAQTLLKLVGLLYSGEVEVRGSLEKDEVLYAARQFGITDLVEGQKEAWGQGGGPRESSCRKTQDGRSGGGQTAAVCPRLKTRRVSVGTQAPEAEGDIAGVPLSHPGQDRPPATLPGSPSAAPRDGDMAATSDSRVAQELTSCQQLPEPEEGPTGSASEPSNPETAGKGAAELKESCREEPPLQGDGQVPGRGSQAGKDSQANTSFKLKLVRTKGKAWEVLNRGDAREAPARASLRPRPRQNNLLETVDLTNVAEDDPISRGMIRPLSRDLRINGSVSEGEGEGQTREKRKRVERDEEGVPLKRTVTADRDGAKETSPNEAQEVNVEDVDQILKHPKTRTLTGRQSGDAAEDAAGLQGEETAGGVLKGQDKDVTEPPVGSRGSLLAGDSADTNHNHILSPTTARGGQLSKDNTNVCGDEDVLPSADELLGPVVHRVPRRRGQTDWDQGPEPLHNSEGSPQLSERLLSPSDTSASLTHDQSSLQTPNRNRPPLNSTCHQEEEVEEEVEEEEVDIICYSPLVHFSLNGNEQVNIGVFPEGEEDEEQSDINVTDD